MLPQRHSRRLTVPLPRPDRNYSKLNSRLIGDPVIFFKHGNKTREGERESGCLTKCLSFVSENIGAVRGNPTIAKESASTDGASAFLLPPRAAQSPPQHKQQQLTWNEGGSWWLLWETRETHVSLRISTSILHFILPTLFRWATLSARLCVIERILRTAITIPVLEYRYKIHRSFQSYRLSIIILRCEIVCVRTFEGSMKLKRSHQLIH